MLHIFIVSGEAFSTFFLSSGDTPTVHFGRLGMTSTAFCYFFYCCAISTHGACDWQNHHAVIASGTIHC